MMRLDHAAHRSPWSHTYLVTSATRNRPRTTTATDPAPFTNHQASRILIIRVQVDVNDPHPRPVAGDVGTSLSP